MMIQSEKKIQKKAKTVMNKAIKNIKRDFMKKEMMIQINKVLVVNQIIVKCQIKEVQERRVKIK